MIDRRVCEFAMLSVPAALVVYLAFNAGGFFPTQVAFVAAGLVAVLVLRIMGSAAPLEGCSRRGVIACVALGGLALLTLLSSAWSNAPGLAVLSYNRVLLYLLALVVTTCLGRTRIRVVWMTRALAAAVVLICTAALITRLLPHTWPTPTSIGQNRLSFPLTYWNALGLLAVFGMVLCLHFSSDVREPPAVRSLAAAALPIVVCTLYFTFSRGSIGVALLAVVLYVAIARPGALWSSLLSAAPATVIALAVAYGANLLATADPTSAGAVRQGKLVAGAVLACVVAAGLCRFWLAQKVDARRRARAARPQPTERAAPRGRRAVPYLISLGAIIAVALALSGPARHEYRVFLSGATPGQTSDLRTRLTDPANDGRLDLWRVAWHGFTDRPLLGNGAGTFADAYAEHRRADAYVINAHSLYLETLDELGIVGFLLLATALVAMIAGAARLVRGPDRAVYAAVLTLMVAWAVESGVDWDWQMPAVTIVVFALGGLALARPPALGRRDGRPSVRLMTPAARAAAAAALLLLAVAPAFTWLAERKLQEASTAFAAGNCRPATADAVASIGILGIQAQPYELAGYCDVREHRPQAAIRALKVAVSLDRDNWNYSYGLAMMRAAGGANPLNAARRAVYLDPREPLVQDAWDLFEHVPRRQWPGDAMSIVDAFTSLS